MQTPVLSLAGSTAGPSASAVNYSSMVGGAVDSSFTATLANAEHIMPIDGVFSLLTTLVPAPTGATKSLTIDMMYDGAGTSLATVATDTDSTYKQDTNAAHNVSVAQGHKVAWRTTPANTPTVGVTSISALFTATTPGESVIFGSASLSGTTTGYHPFSDYRGTPTTTETVASVVVAAAGVLDRLYVNLSGAPGTAASGKKYTITVYKNGSATGITCDILDTATSNQDLTNSISVAAGDLISWESTVTSSPTARRANVSMRFVPTVPGKSLLFSRSVTALSSSAARYMDLNGSSSNVATEGNYQNIAPAGFDIKEQYVKLNTAPGGSTNRAFALRVNEATPGTNVENTVTGAATTAGPSANTVSVTAGQRLGWMTTPGGGTPADAGTYKVGAVAYIASVARSSLTLLGVG